MTSTAPAENQASVPLAIRVGGAFMAVAVVLFIFLAIQMFTEGFMAPFSVNVRFLLIVAAGALLGAFATMNTNQKASVTQVVALCLALLLAVSGRFLPNPELTVWAQYWLATYALLALLCALILRRVAVR